MSRTTIESYNFSRLSDKTGSVHLYSIDLIAEHDASYSIECKYGIQDRKLTHNSIICREEYLACQVKLVAMVQEINFKGYELNDKIPNPILDRQVLERSRLTKTDPDIGEEEFYEIFLVYKEDLEDEYTMECSYGHGTVPYSHSPHQTRCHYAASKLDAREFEGNLIAEGFIVERYTDYREDIDCKEAMKNITHLESPRSAVVFVSGELSNSRTVAISVIGTCGNIQQIGNVTIPNRIPIPMISEPIEISYSEIYEDGSLANPTFTKPRSDLRPRHCTTEQLTSLERSRSN